MKEKFKVKRSKINAKGIFSSSPIKKNETICYLKGKRISINTLKKLYDSNKERMTDPLQISSNQYIDIDKPYLYFNHTCNPNAAVIKKNKLIAIKDIKKNNEITFDYATTVWKKEQNKERKEWGNYADMSIKCNCKSKNCRKIIGDFLDIPKKLRERYIELKIVPNFIIKNYKKYKK